MKARKVWIAPKGLAGPCLLKLAAALKSLIKSHSLSPLFLPKNLLKMMGIKPGTYCMLNVTELWPFLVHLQARKIET